MDSEPQNTATPSVPDVPAAQAPAPTEPTQPAQAPSAPVQDTPAATPPQEQPEQKTSSELDIDIAALGESPETQAQAAREKEEATLAAFAKEAGLGDKIADVVLSRSEDGSPSAVMPAKEVGALVQAMRSSGIEPGKAQSVIGMVAALENIREQSRAAAEAEALRAVRAETRAEFGEGLGVAARNMVAAGHALFGTELWNFMREGAPLLVNDKRFVRAMAAYGARLRNDNGGPSPTSRGATTPDGKIAFDLSSFAEGTK